MCSGAGKGFGSLCRCYGRIIGYTPCIGFAGGVFMCRRNQVCGYALISFGFGLLVGLCLESGFLFALIGLGIIGLGFWCCGKR